jgi:hypothetical protein
MHIELLAFSATAPGAAGAAATVVGATDSLVIKNDRGSKPPKFITLWGKQQTAGFQQIVTPTQHDTTRGFRYNVGLNEQRNVLPQGLSLEVQPQETLTITIAGSATAGDVEIGAGLICYPNLPGVTQRLITFAQLEDKLEKFTTVSSTITGAATGYTGGELITAESDLLRANTDYAVLGMTTNTACAAIVLRGPDTGYVRIGLPGDPDDTERTQDYFCQLSRSHGMPLIPVINSGNKASTFLEILQDENNVSPLVTLFLAQLR